MSDVDESSFVVEFLGKFSYFDWDTGDDDKLRVGDYLVMVHQNNYTGSETIIPARIDLFDNGIPMFIINEEPAEIGDSGEYVSIFHSFLDGYEFSRISWEDWLKEVNDFHNEGRLPVQF